MILATREASPLGCSHDPWTTASCALPQLRIFNLSLFQDGSFRIGVFQSSRKSRICVPGFRGVAGQGIGAAELQPCEGRQRGIQRHAAVVEEFLELGGGFYILM